MKASSVTQPSTFAADVLRGLSATPKFLSSKYFYDDEGSRLFQEIMQLPEYYLTRCEREILTSQAAAIYEAFATTGTDFDLIELGAGDGTKTALLLKYFLQQAASFIYTPIDISREAIAALTTKFVAQFPHLQMRAQTGDYLQILETLHTRRRKIILFLGSNIGNFSRAEAQHFFRRLHAVMRRDDLLLVGFDLQKDPRVIVRAYDDAQGVTAQFNLNLLRRLNRELGADFVLEQFSHYASYHPLDCAARSFLVSRTAQHVRLAALRQTFSFQPWEPIFTEISQKYSLAMIDELAEASGFRVAHNFFDRQQYFADSLWQWRA
ncbi:MAG: L-histidine N(alpha)-methyltransferase [Blastocatellia bacterium]